MDKEVLELILNLKEEEVKSKVRECLALSYDNSFIIVKDEEKLAELLNLKLNKKQEKGE